MTVIKVLLVDDEEEFTAALAERLETRGLSVTVASSGEEALAIIGESGFDAVVLDMMMPGMDGMETLTRMLTERPNLQIIMLTGHAQLAQGIAAVKAGAMDYVEKPIAMPELLKKIEEAKTKSDECEKQQAQDDIDGILGRKGW
jgi:DNA-binding response OmpR family regulator